MQRIFLSCKSVDDARFLKNYLETELPYEVILGFSPRDVEQAVRQRQFHLLITQTGNLARQDLNFAKQLRDLGYSYPIMTITDSLGVESFEEAAEKLRLFFLERPFELKALKGLARKLMVAKSVSQQIFRRYRTNLNATVETFVSGERYTTHMFNLSRGGAYFELSQRPIVSVGDLLRVKVSLADVEKDHQVHGRVVWTTHKGHSAGGYGLGVKFMKSNEIYRSLLDKV
jgi:DNA-binding NtrC family response regulator